MAKSLTINKDVMAFFCFFFLLIQFAVLCIGIPITFTPFFFFLILLGT